MSAAARRARRGSGARRAPRRTHAGITVIGMLTRRGAIAHAAEDPAILRRRNVVRNLAIAEPLTRLLPGRPELFRLRTRQVLPHVPLKLRTQGVSAPTGKPAPPPAAKCRHPYAGSTGG